jgi:hypothetical protein
MMATATYSRTGWPETTVRLRERLEQQIEQMIAVLDMLDASDEDVEPDADFEPNNDDEWWLGWSEGIVQRVASDAQMFFEPLERDFCVERSA